MKKRHEMAFDVAALPNYVNQNSDELLMAANYGFKTGSLVSIQEGIKLTDALQYLEVSPTRQAATCSLSAAGDAVFEQKTITVVNLAYKISLCMQDLIPKWTQRALPNGSNAEDEAFTFESEITANFLQKIAQDNEDAVWFSTAGAGTFDGFGTIIDAGTAAGTITAGAFVSGIRYQIITVGTTDYTLIGATANTVGVEFVSTGVGAGTGTALDMSISPINGNSSKTTVATGITNANAFSLVQDNVDRMPDALKGNPNAIGFVGMDTFDKYRRNLITLNLFHESSVDGYSAVVPYTGLRIEGVPGLSGTDRMFFGERSNFVLGADMQNGYEDAKSWFDENTDLTFLQVKFKMGTQVKFLQEIVQFTLV